MLHCGLLNFLFVPKLKFDPGVIEVQTENMNWNTLNTASQIDEIVERSKQVPCLIFKHSTTCPISSIAKHRLEDDWPFAAGELETYYLDLLAFRPVSNVVAEKLNVHHESPQIILISKGEVILDASHLGISTAEIKEVLEYEKA